MRRCVVCVCELCLVHKHQAPQGFIQHFSCLSVCSTVRLPRLTVVCSAVRLRRRARARDFVFGRIWYYISFLSWYYRNEPPIVVCWNLCVSVFVVRLVVFLFVILPVVENR